MSMRSPHASGLGTPPQVLPENGQQAEGAAARPPRLSVRSPRKSGMGQAAEGGLQAEGTPGRFPRPSVLSPRKSTILRDAPVVSEPAGGASGESSDDDLVALSPARAPRASAMAPPRHSVAPQRMSMAPQRLSVAPSQRLSISPGKAANGQWGGPGGSGEPAGGRLTQLSPRLSQRASAMPAQRLSLRPAAATPAAEGSSDDDADDLLSRAAAAGARRSQMHPSQPQDSMPASDPAAARAPPRLSQALRQSAPSLAPRAPLHGVPSRHASATGSERSAEEVTLKSVRSAGASDLKDQDEWAYCRSEPSRAEMFGPDGLGPTLEQEILAQIQERRSRVQPKGAPRASTSSGRMSGTTTAADAPGQRLSMHQSSTSHLPEGLHEEATLQQALASEPKAQRISSSAGHRGPISRDDSFAMPAQQTPYYGSDSNADADRTISETTNWVQQEAGSAVPPAFDSFQGVSPEQTYPLQGAPSFTFAPAPPSNMASAQPAGQEQAPASQSGTGPTLQRVASYARPRRPTEYPPGQGAFPFAFMQNMQAPPQTPQPSSSQPPISPRQSIRTGQPDASQTAAPIQPPQEPRRSLQPTAQSRQSIYAADNAAAMSRQVGASALGGAAQQRPSMHAGGPAAPMGASSRRQSTAAEGTWQSFSGGQPACGNLLAARQSITGSQAWRNLASHEMTSQPYSPRPGLTPPTQFQSEGPAPAGQTAPRSLSMLGRRSFMQDLTASTLQPPRRSMVAEQEPSSSQPAAIFQHEPSESITPVGDGMPSRNSSRQSVMHDQPELEDTSDFVGVMSLERKQRGSEFRSQDGFGSELASANLQPELPSPRARSRSPSVVQGPTWPSGPSGQQQQQQGPIQRPPSASVGPAPTSGRRTVAPAESDLRRPSAVQVMPELDGQRPPPPQEEPMDDCSSMGGLAAPNNLRDMHQMEAGWEVRWARQAGQMQRLYGHLGLDQPAADPDTEQGPSQLPPDRHTPEQQEPVEQEQGQQYYPSLQESQPQQALMLADSDGLASGDGDLEARLADMEARMTQRLNQLVQLHEDQVAVIREDLHRGVVAASRSSSPERSRPHAAQHVEQQAAWQQLMEQQLEQLQQQVGRDPLPGQLAGMEQALRQLQAQADSTPTHSTLGSLRTHVDHLMASLEARTAEAGLYRRQYDALSSRLDHIEKAHREARLASRHQAETE
ncbi:hypothetical protein WJX84_000532, partial [Apatococcus fuscideae]